MTVHVICEMEGEQYPGSSVCTKETPGGTGTEVVYHPKYEQFLTGQGIKSVCLICGAGAHRGDQPQ